MIWLEVKGKVILVRQQTKRVLILTKVFLPYVKSSQLSLNAKKVKLGKIHIFHIVIQNLHVSFDRVLEVTVIVLWLPVLILVMLKLMRILVLCNTQVKQALSQINLSGTMTQRLVRSNNWKNKFVNWLQNWEKQTRPLIS